MWLYSLHLPKQIFTTKRRCGGGGLKPQWEHWSDFSQPSIFLKSEAIGVPYWYMFFSVFFSYFFLGRFNERNVWNFPLIFTITRLRSCLLRFFLYSGFTETSPTIHKVLPTQTTTLLRSIPDENPDPFSTWRNSSSHQLCLHTFTEGCLISTHSTHHLFNLLGSCENDKEKGQGMEEVGWKKLVGRCCWCCCCCWWCWCWCCCCCCCCCCWFSESHLAIYIYTTSCIWSYV